MELIRRILAELITSNVATVDADVPMMELGLDSLAATEVPSRISALTGIQLSSTLLFEQPTPRALANHVLDLVGSMAPQSRVSSTVLVAPIRSRADRVSPLVVSVTLLESATWTSGLISLQRAAGDVVRPIAVTCWAPQYRWAEGKASGLSTEGREDAAWAWRAWRAGGMCSSGGREELVPAMDGLRARTPSTAAAVSYGRPAGLLLNGRACT